MTPTPAERRFKLSMERISASDSMRAEEARASAKERLEAIKKDQADCHEACIALIFALGDKMGATPAERKIANASLADILNDLTHEKREAIAAEIEDANHQIERATR